MLITKNSGTEIMRCEQCMEPVNTYITFKIGVYVYHVCNAICMNLLLKAMEKTKRSQNGISN